MSLLEIKRNDPCPCGSGKKYKKCCQLKENVAQLAQVKQEQFFTLKNKMVHMITDFTNSKLSFREENLLKQAFKKRINTEMSTGAFNAFFKFWLFFFHQFENKLRGVEWFYEERGKFLSPEANKMAQRWTTLVPKLIQAVDQNENGMIAKDLKSNEKVFMPFSETLEEIRPWQVTFGLIEPFHNEYFFNGVISWAAPHTVDKIVNEINQFRLKTGKSHDQVVMEYYPELLSIVLNNNNVVMSERNGRSSDIIEELLIYTLLNKEKMINYLIKSKDFILGENGESITWIGDWYCYTDSELTDPVYFAESYGNIAVKDDELIVESTYPGRIAEFEKWAKQFSSDIALRRRDKKVHTVPAAMNFENYYVRSTKDTPQYFLIFAQTRMKLDNLDKSIPQFDGLSPRAMVNIGRNEELQRWLEQYEFHSNMIIKESTKAVKYTEDFNWIRKELGLPLSPFVTNYATRETSISRTNRPKDTVRIIELEIPYFKQLGFTPETATDFYAQEMVDFFMKKTDGKSKGTITKYQNGLSYLVNYFSAFNEEIVSWKMCTDVFWEQLISNVSNSNLTYAQKKAILSSLNTFIKWIDRSYDTNHSSVFKEITI